MVEVAVEPLGDGLVAKPLRHPPGEDLRDHWGTFGVEGQAGLGLAVGAFGRHRVRDPLGLVAVGRPSDVPALAGMLAHPIVGLLKDLEHVPLGRGLLDAAGDDLGGALAAGQ